MLAKKKQNNIQNTIKNNKGQGVMEYMIITSLVGVLCITAMKDFGQTIQTRIDKAKSKIVRSIDIK
ncbi:MAG: hypothetical protein BM556_02175 [Bacteriovorax sp. MedPE-SWde]|nr:MAG: hypothetical protein BM556_02175 [Bacteriovorax sp. MedPE-SWde]